VKKLNVMHLTYDMRIGGTEMVIKNIIEGADKALFAMSIFCIEQPIGPWGIDLQKSGVPIDAKERKPGFDTSLIFDIRKHLKQHKIDVMHCHQYSPWVYGVLAALGTKTKVIFTEHGRFYPDSSSWKRKIINPILSYFTDAITCISAATKQALVQYEFLNANKIEVIHNGIDAIKQIDNAQTNVYSQYNIPTGHFIVGTIARMDPIKNHSLMIRAIKECINKNMKVHFVLVGDGEMRSAIKSEISQLALQKCITLTGYQKDPAPFINIFDVFLLTSFSEGMSMTLLESMSIGLPCIVTRVGGNAEVVAHEQTGLVIENNNLEQLTSAIGTLANSPDKTKAFSDASVKIFNKQFTQQLMNQKYQSCYTSAFKK
jgi:glycosyltransferase involved in cell wall biosynthesis